jgi:hypothetical protein
MANNIAALLHGRDNNFNLIRFLAASAVILDHSFVLVTPDRAASAAINFAGLDNARGGRRVLHCLRSSRHP